MKSQAVREESIMSTASAVADPLLTAEEYARRPDPGYPEELVRGRIVPMPQPTPRHGEICAQTVYLYRRFLDDHDLGKVVSNDAGVITERDPDTVRGADVAFYSYQRVRRGPLPKDYLPVPPDLIVEVRSPSDRWPKILAKVVEYLEAGVLAVVVLDDDSRTALLATADQAPRRLGPDDELTIPEILPGFAVPVRRFFE
jgi:Uma2 family endonuclease